MHKINGNTPLINRIYEHYINTYNYSRSLSVCLDIFPGCGKMAGQSDKTACISQSVIDFQIFPIGLNSNLRQMNFAKCT